MNYRKKFYKCLMLILESFKCDKSCPYCTAKITNWERGGDLLEKLDQIFSEFKGVTIKEFVLSGNGEPGLYSYKNLKLIVDTVSKHSELFEIKRIQTGGNLFMTDKFHLFKNYDFKITRVSPDFVIDKEYLIYV